MENLREALIKADYTVDGVLEVLGPLAYAALARSESVPSLRATTGGSPVETLIRLFLLQQPVGRKAADAALPVADSLAAGLVELDGVSSDEIELSVVDGERTLTLGDEQSDMALPPLDALAEEHDAVAIHAERVDGNTYAVDVFPL